MATRTAKASRNGTGRLSNRGNRSAPPPGGDRDEAGRFLPGCKPGPGNPFFRQLAARRKALVGAVSPEQVAALARQLLTQAMAGDLGAAELLLRYVCGRAVPVADPDQADLHELALLRQCPDVAELAAKGKVAPALGVWEILRQLARTPDELLDALSARMRELVEEARAQATPAEYLQLERLAEAAGIDDDEEGTDDGEG